MVVDDSWALHPFFLGGYHNPFTGDPVLNQPAFEGTTGF